MDKKDIEGIAKQAADKVCRWYVSPKANSKLDQFIKERTYPDAYIEWCDNEDNLIVQVEYVRCVKLKDIRIPEPWSEERTKAIRKWANPDRLRTLKFRTNENGEEILDTRNLPEISREVNVHDKTPEKFEIQNGIHRINIAKELGIDCILARVTESTTIAKNDKEEYIEQRDTI